MTRGSFHLATLCFVGLPLGAGCDSPAPRPTAASAVAEPSAVVAPSASAAPSISASSAPVPSASASASASVSASAAPSASAGPPSPVGGNWLRCYRNFQPRTQPKLDAMRLGVMCGPSNGMTQVAAVESRVREQKKGREHRWQAASGDCFRIFAVGSPQVEDLDVEVYDAKRRRVAADTTDDRWPIVKPDGPFCVFDPGEYRAVVRAQRGSGDYAIEIWRLR